MQLPCIKTYKPNTPRKDNQFYILSKGRNSGRPSHTPNRNSFTVTCDSIEQHDQLYILCFVLWKGRFFHRYLRGTCVQFISLKEFKKIVQSAMDKLEDQPEKLETTARTLKQIEEAEKLISQKLQVIGQMKLLLVQLLK